MSLEEFKQKVLGKLWMYTNGKTRQELLDAIEEYPDIIQDGYHHHYGLDYGCDYAAWNISLCI